MSQQIELAMAAFSGAEGRMSGTFNSVMALRPSLYGPTLTEFLTGMQRQAQGLVHLARAIAEMETQLQNVEQMAQQLNAIKRKLAIP